MGTGGEGRENCSRNKTPKDTPEDTTSMKARRLAGIRTTKPLTEEDIPRLREQWFQKYSDILSGAPPELPPLREVNHRIPLTDEGKRYMLNITRVLTHVYLLT